MGSRDSLRLMGDKISAEYNIPSQNEGRVVSTSGCTEPWDKQIVRSGIGVFCEMLSLSVPGLRANCLPNLC